MQPKLPSRSPGGGSGRPVNPLTAEDVAAALSYSHLTPLAYELARAKYTLDMRAREAVREYIYWAVTKWAEDSKVNQAELSEILLEEHIDSKRCKRCNGTGLNRRMKPCKACDGTGIPKVSDASKARRLGISRQYFARVWKDRLAYISQQIVNADNSVLEAVGKKI